MFLQRLNICMYSLYRTFPKEHFDPIQRAAQIIVAVPSEHDCQTSLGLRPPGYT